MTKDESRKENIRRAFARNARGKGGGRTQARIAGALVQARERGTLPHTGSLPAAGVRGVTSQAAMNSKKAPSGTMTARPNRSVPPGYSTAGKSTGVDQVIRRRRRRRRSSGEIIEG